MRITTKTAIAARVCCAATKGVAPSMMVGMAAREFRDLGQLWLGRAVFHVGQTPVSGEEAVLG